MKKRIALLPGDGIGPEVAESAADVLKSVAEQFGHEFEFENGLIGGAAIDAHQNPLPEETVALCERSDAILLGAVGGPKWTKILQSSDRKKACLASEKNSACLPICVP